jgi:hypothetical protein
MNPLSQQKQLAWAEHIKVQRESGLSQQAYCEQHSLKPNQFWYWRRKLQGSSNNTVSKTRAIQPGFVAAKVIGTPVAQGLTVTLPNGIIISGIEELNHCLVKDLLGALT